jgi:tetratricopeptide (TPR) repeat protein
MVTIALLCGCARSPEAKRDKYLTRGKAYLEKKDYARAVLEFRNAARATPKDAEVYYQLGLAYVSSLDYRSGYMSFRKALEFNPKHREAELRLAQILAMTNDPAMLKDAQSRLTALRGDRPGDIEVLNTLAFTELKLGQTDSAARTYEDVLAQSPGELFSATMLARTRLSQNDPKGAEEILAKAVKDTPKSAPARRTLAEFYVYLNRQQDAERLLNEALALDAADGQSLMDLARLQWATGRKAEAEQTFRKLSTQEGYRPVYGMFLFEEGRVDDGVREFERQAQANPDDRGVRTRLIAAYRQARRPADAEKALAEALKKNPKDTDALVQRAEMSIDSAKYSDAEADLNRALKLKPNAPELHYVMARLFKGRGEPLRYRQELSEALRLNPELLQLRLEMAQALIDANDAKGALGLTDAAPEFQRQEPALIAQRNWALWRMGDLAQMRQGVDRGLAANRTPALLVQDGLLKLRAGDAVAARSAVEEALKIDPGAVMAFRVLGETYAAQKRTDLGIEKVKEYAKAQPKSAPVQHFLGTMLLGAGDRAGARAAFEAAHTADPQFLSAQLSLVQVETLDKRFDEARARLKSILGADGSNITARRWLANIEVMRQDYDAAIEQFRKVLQTDPGDAQAANNLAYLLMERRNQIDEGLKYAQKAVDVAPGQPEYSDTLGWGFYRKGLYSMAVPPLERATKAKSHAVWQYHLAMAYAKSGRPEKARQAFQAGQKLNAGIPEAKVAQQVVDGAK